MINLSIRAKVRPDKKKEFLRVILGFRSTEGLIEHLRNQKGCLNYNIRKSKNNRDEFFIEAEWNNQEDFDAHLRGKQIAILFGAIDTLCEEKEVKFSNKNGLKTIHNN